MARTTVFLEAKLTSTKGKTTIFQADLNKSNVSVPKTLSYCFANFMDIGENNTTHDKLQKTRKYNRN